MQSLIKNKLMSLNITPATVANKNGVDFKIVEALINGAPQKIDSASSLVLASAIKLSINDLVALQNSSNESDTTFVQKVLIALASELDAKQLENVLKEVAKSTGYDIVFGHKPSTTRQETLHKLSSEFYSLFNISKFAKFIVNDLVNEYFEDEQPDGSLQWQQQLAIKYYRAQTQTNMLLSYICSLNKALYDLETIAHKMNLD